MGAQMSDLHRELSSPSKGRDTLIRAVRKGKFTRLLDHLDQHPQDWSLVEAHIGSVIEALIERHDLKPNSPEVTRLLSKVNPAKLYAKISEIVLRGELDWALPVVTMVLTKDPQADHHWWWLLALIQADLKRVDDEHETLNEVLKRSSEPEVRIKVAGRLLEIGRWRDAFPVLGELHDLPAWHDDVVKLMAHSVLVHGPWSDPDLCSDWDYYWSPILDHSGRVGLWAEILQMTSEQVAYDRDALADGINAMQECLYGITGRDLQADGERAHQGHELALKLMRFVRSFEPLELHEQSVYTMMLDRLVTWENLWTEHGFELTCDMEKELGSVRVDGPLFATALDILGDQFVTQLSAPAMALLHVHRDPLSQVVIMTLEPAEPSKCLSPQPLATMDAAFVSRVMKSHGCQWRYDGPLGASLSVTIASMAPARTNETVDEEYERKWLTSWQIRGRDGLATLEQQDRMTRQPLSWGLRLALGLKRTLIADWAEQIRVIVHDLKNLFTFVQQWISQALSDPYSWMMAMERVSEIKARMQETLKEIRELALLSGPPTYAPISVVELVRKVIANSRAFLEARAVHCVIEQRTGRGEVWGDPERLISAITNLLKNGAEAMPQGGLLSVTVDQNDQSFVQLVIADTGVGIEADELPLLFAAGRTTKPGGSGVGLAAVARSLASMGAEITVESSPGLGSRFVITFTHNTIKTQHDTRSIPVPNDRQSKATQQALRAAAALNAVGDHKMTVHLWLKALIAQIEPPLRRAFPPVRSCHLLAPLTLSTKRGTQLQEADRIRLQVHLDCSSKQLVKKCDTVIQTLISGDWDRLTHPLHWAILLYLFTDADAYPWPSDLCRQMARWLTKVNHFDGMDELDSEHVVNLGSELSTILELALMGYLGA